MAIQNLFPDKTINYRIYIEDEMLIGTGTVELPELAYMTDTLSGAGIAGEVDTPTLGHMQSMSMTVNFRTINTEMFPVLNVDGRTLTLRSSQQIYTTENGATGTQAVKIVAKTLPKTISLGSLEPGAETGSSIELELTYLKVEIAGETKIEIDKFNFKCQIGDKDLLESVRKDLGF